MNGQITPEHVEMLLALNVLILVCIMARLIGLTVWRKWFRDAAPDNLTQEERDLRRVQRRGRR